ncbi:MAG: hypothetical protein LQ346_005984 [Caloplaca aetnensis]|nr:MAG: hypothetical protein LQ346_005984 [Caloplaca aetnensis]
MTCISLPFLRQCWQGLRQVSSQPSVSLESKTGGFKSDAPGPAGADEAVGKYGCKKGISRRQARFAVRQLCLTYLNSFPGASNRGSNVSIHSHARDLIRGEPKSKWQIEELRLTLTYRMEMMYLASEYKSMMGLDFPDCDMFDFDEWERSDLQGGKGKAKQEDDKKYNFFLSCQTKVYRAKLFPDAPLIEGHGLLLSLSYTKPNNYLAVALAESGLGPDAVSAAVARLVPCKSTRSTSLTIL